MGATLVGVSISATNAEANWAVRLICKRAPSHSLPKIGTRLRTELGVQDVETFRQSPRGVPDFESSVLVPLKAYIPDNITRHRQNASNAFPKT